MSKVVFIITTRDFPFDSNLFEDVKSNQLDEFVIADDKKKLLSKNELTDATLAAKKDNQKEEEYQKEKQKQISRYLRSKFWADSRARYIDSDYLESGLKVRKRISDSSDNFIVYVAPCTSNNGVLSSELKLEYTKKIVEIVKKDLEETNEKDINGRYLIAHDSDISKEAGPGVGPKIDGFLSYKFQHIENTDPIWTLIIKNIDKENSVFFRNCDKVYSLIKPLVFLVELSNLNLPIGNDCDDKVTLAYKNISFEP